VTKYPFYLNLTPASAGVLFVQNPKSPQTSDPIIGESSSHSHSKEVVAGVSFHDSTAQLN